MKTILHDEFLMTQVGIIIGLLTYIIILVVWHSIEGWIINRKIAKGTYYYTAAIDPYEKRKASRSYIHVITKLDVRHEQSNKSAYLNAVANMSRYYAASLNIKIKRDEFHIDL